MKHVFWTMTVALLATSFLAAACGGGGSSREHEGAAAFAVANYFRQERDGGLIEGTQIAGKGSQQVKALQNMNGSEARYCVQYGFSIGTQLPQTRVYIATLNKGAWAVELVKPDGNCDDVG